MVKIIGESRDFVRRTVCRNCSTELEYTESEVKEENWRDIDGGSAGKRFIDCPRCGAQPIIKSW